jgi:signal transduction histidine kinase
MSSHGRIDVPPEGDGRAANLGVMRKGRLLDLGIPVAVFVLTLALIAAPEATDSRGDARGLDALAVLLAALTSAPLLLRHRAPLLGFTLSTLASTILFGADYPPGPPIGPTVALYFVAVASFSSARRRVFALVVTAVLLLVHVTVFGVTHDTVPDGELLMGTVLWAAVWLAGETTRMRRSRIHELEERAVRAERDAERERRLAAAEERTRIARDLHDSAGHAINVILVHAGAARLLAEKDPSRSREALGTIESVARETLREIDALVRALREDDESVQPPAGLLALDALVKRHRDAGLAVDVSVSGERRPLGPAADQAAYRILQEALTNALRHGNGRAEVALTYEVDALQIAVSNPTAGNGTAPAGHGIVGMHERATLLGGSVDVEPVNGRFAVHARLPYCEEDE